MNPVYDDTCNATIDLGARGFALCYLRRGHTGSHRHSEFLAAVRDAAVPVKWDGSGVLGDGRGVAGRWVPLKLYQEIRDDRDRAREIIAQLLADAAHTDWGDCEPWDSIVDAETYLTRRAIRARDREDG